MISSAKCKFTEPCGAWQQIYDFSLSVIGYVSVFEIFADRYL